MNDDVTVLYEDAALLAVQKPAGVVVIPSRAGDADDACLRGRLERQRGERLWVVHRLDRDTSGVLLFARSADAHRIVNGLFEGRSVRKRYLAWTRGPLPDLALRCDGALHPARKGRMRPAVAGEAGALAAATVLREDMRWEGLAIGTVARVEASPETGRQHQIRVHLRSLGVPLVVDAIYGRCAELTLRDLGLDEDGPALGRLALHAASITLRSPDRGEVTVEAPLPDDLVAWERALQRAVIAARSSSRPSTTSDDGTVSSGSGASSVNS